MTPGFREQFTAGAPLLGTFVKTPSHAVVEVLGTTGLDFLVIDMEHAPIGAESRDRMLLAAHLVQMGVVTTGHYSMAHKSALNDAFVAEYLADYPGEKWPNFLSVSAYDGMAALYRGLEKTGGDATGPALAKALAGETIESPRGPITIDAETRDIVQTIYVRKVERVGDRLMNVEIHEFPESRDSAAAK